MVNHKMGMALDPAIISKIHTDLVQDKDNTEMIEEDTSKIMAEVHLCHRTTWLSANRPQDRELPLPADIAEDER